VNLSVKELVIIYTVVASRFLSIYKVSILYRFECYRTTATRNWTVLSASIQTYGVQFIIGMLNKVQIFEVRNVYSNSNSYFSPSTFRFQSALIRPRPFLPRALSSHTFHCETRFLCSLPAINSTDAACLPTTPLPSPPFLHTVAPFNYSHVV